MYVALHRPHGALHFTLYTLHFTHTYRDTKIAPTSARAAHAVHARARAVVHRCITAAIVIGNTVRVRLRRYADDKPHARRGVREGAAPAPHIIVVQR